MSGFYQIASLSRFQGLCVDVFLLDLLLGDFGRETDAAGDPPAAVLLVELGVDPPALVALLLPLLLLVVAVDRVLAVPRPLFELYIN